VRDEKPWLRAPESAAVPLAGVPGWSPEHEDPHAAFCPDCRGPLRAVPIAPGCPGPLAGAALRRPAAAVHAIGAPEEPLRLPSPCTKCGRSIGPRSGLFCPKCVASGYDGPLARQRQIAGLPPAERPKPPPRAYRPSRGRPAASARPIRRQRRALQYAGTSG
jgi:hypothetical protein